MISTIIIGLGVLAAGMVAFKYWDEIVDWLKDFVSTLANLFVTVASGIWHAAGVFVKFIKEGLVATQHKLYYKENEQYIERITTRTIPESELPAWVKAKMNNTQETDISDEVERELQLKL